MGRATVRLQTHDPLLSATVEPLSNQACRVLGPCECGRWQMSSPKLAMPKVGQWSIHLQPQRQGQSPSPAGKHCTTPSGNLNQSRSSSSSYSSCQRKPPNQRTMLSTLGAQISPQMAVHCRRVDAAAATRATLSRRRGPSWQRLISHTSLTVLLANRQLSRQSIGKCSSATH